MAIIEFLKQPWAWYVSGISLTCIFLLLVFFGKKFGFSSNLRTLCAMCGLGKRVKFFDYNWRLEIWNLLFLLGSVIGGFIAHQYLSTPAPIQISQATINDLHTLGFGPPHNIEPPELFSIDKLTDIKTLFLLIIGGLLVGFGTRWAGGCTSGHAISGLSELQLPSLIAVIGFFIGGFIMTFFLYPLIF